MASRQLFIQKRFCLNLGMSLFDFFPLLQSDVGIVS
jgi:hypothetical protein